MLDYDPYDVLQRARPVASFSVTSADFEHGGPLPRGQWAAFAGGADRSPQLSWSGFPSGTRSFVVTCLDADAPSASGWWHWVVANIPASVTSLDTNAGAEGGAGLPQGALMLRNEDGEKAFSGVGPPRGTGVHRYMFVVHALDVPSFDLDPDASPASLGTRCFFHALGRGILVGTATRD